MKIITLLASYRKKGNTARMVEMIGESLRNQAGQEAISFEVIYLGHSNLQLCRGCRVCFDRGEAYCALKDDMPDITARIQSADVIIAASPVYVNDVSGTMKNFIDRMAYMCHRPGLAGKSVFVLATTGTTPPGRALNTLKTAFSLWGATIIGQAGYVMGALIPATELEARYHPKADLVARQILLSQQNQSALRPSFRALITFKIQQLAWQRHTTPSYDLEYWQKKDWLNPKCQYYLPHHANPIKVATARLAGSLMAPFVLGK